VTIAWNSNYNETMPFSDTCFQVACTSNAEQTATIPGDSTMYFQAYFEYISTSNVYICLNSTPTIPAGGTVGTQQYNEFRPIKRLVRGGDVIHFITPDATARIGVSVRQLQK
jgi:hypothetical protein